MWKILLLIHGVAAAGLLGMVTHQSLSVLMTGNKKSFVGSYVAVRSLLFTNTIIVTFLFNFLMGMWIYTRYRYTARPALEDLNLQAYVGAFEFKEHLLAIILFTLPAYWVFWNKVPLETHPQTRTILTLFVGCSIWIAYLVGHLVNNARGI